MALLVLGGCRRKLDGVGGWAASQTNTCAITGGKIVCWGSDFGKSSAVPLAGVEDAVEIANDNSTFYWRTGAGAVFAFSSNFINLEAGIDPRRGKVAIVPIVGSGAYGLAENGVYLVATETTNERRRFALLPAPPARPTVTHFDPIPLAAGPRSRPRAVGDGYLRDGELAMPDVRIAHGPDRSRPSTDPVTEGSRETAGPLRHGPDRVLAGRFVDRTGVNSHTHFVSDETGTVFAFQGRNAGEHILREISELKGATSVVDTGDLRCAVFAGELRCSGNRRALGGATADGEATWKLVALPFDEPIREVGVGVGWVGGGYPNGVTRPDSSKKSLEVSGFVVAITASGAFYQWGDSDYGALNGNQGFVKEPMLVKLRRF